jgi:hypothetical protein
MKARVLAVASLRFAADVPKNAVGWTVEVVRPEGVDFLTPEQARALAETLLTAANCADQERPIHLEVKL